VKNVIGAVALTWVSLFIGSAAQAQEIYVHGGTLGAGVGAAYSFNTWSGVHAEVEGFGLSHSVTIDDIKYDGHLKLLQGGLYLDLFPIPNSGFRITGGALINDDDLKAHAIANADGNYKIGDTVVPAIGPAPSLVAKLPAVMPYLGIGYGHKPMSKGFGFTFDLGVAYGRPRVSYSVPAIYSQFVTQASIDDEERQISSSIERYKLYPVLQLGVTYRF
jgi:hypothetical protein